MEPLCVLAAKFAALFAEPIVQWLCYSCNYDRNIENMEELVKNLQLKRDEVQDSVESMRRRSEAIPASFATWLTEVDKTVEEATQVLKAEERGLATCFIWAYLKLVPRHQLSRKAKKILQDIDKHLKDYDRLEKVSDRRTLQERVPRRQMDYEDFVSRMSTAKGLMEALRDANINVIGVWGMPGVGKTMLVKEVERQAKVENLFDRVAFAEVTDKPDLTQIQRDIMETLGFNFDVNMSLTRRASCIRRWLEGKKDKNALVILDDIWKDLDLVKIGIPSEGCKILLTSRNRNVLCNGMGVQKTFELEILAKEEAWNLFAKMAGDCVNYPSFRSTAIEIVKECAGLPLALVIVSKELNNKGPSEWEDALHLLRRPTPGHLNIMQSTIYPPIELSYKHLENKAARDVFLLCSQLGYFFHERDLFKYCYGLGLFHGVSSRMEVARNRLSTILRRLKDCCLLIHNPYSLESLGMHNVVRATATLIALRDHHKFVVRADGRIQEFPNVNELKRYQSYSILGGDIHEFPQEMEYPELEFLYVCCDDRPLQISNTFFEGMRKLEVLVLTRMQLLSLPSTLHLLANLQTLCLDQCVLRDIAEIGKLNNLAVLSLLRSDISQLPTEIKSLTSLRLLDLSHCSKLEVIPPNVLSSLVKLEELYMSNSFTQWEVEGLNNERNNASLAELMHLTKLTTLEIHIRDASNMPKDLSFDQEFKRFVVFVGDVWDWLDRRGEASRILKLKLNTSFKLEVGIKMLLKKSESIYLDVLKDVKNVLYELDREGFKQLKHLHIQCNAEIKCIIKSRMSVIAFPALETFLLKNMIGLEEICHGQLPSTSFCILRVVKVEHCDKLKFVFSSSIARDLSQLEELEIRECKSMCAIVMNEEGGIEDQHTSLFPKLRCLALEHLPKLMSFLSTQNSLVADAGEISLEGEPDFHMPILHEEVVFSDLKSLQLSSIGLEDIQHNQHQATRSSCRLERFQNLLRLEVQGSCNIKHLLLFSTAKCMVQLKYLRITECKVMEEIVTEDEGGVEKTIDEVFPRLEVLFLEELPMLKRFCEGSNIKFLFLKELWIKCCPKLNTFISKPVSLLLKTSNELKEMNAEESPHTTVQPLFNEEVAFPSLEFLTISHMDELKIIWRNQFAMDSFDKLQRIVVEFCKNLVYIFQSNMLTRFQSLEELTIRDCGSLQEVYELQGLNVTEPQAVTPIQLKELYLIRLPNLRYVWSKDPKPTFSFQNLQRVRVVRCMSLKSLFPASVAKCLTHLENLVIVRCKVLEEIVAREEQEQPIPTFILRNVIVLHLALLPRLKWFYPRMNTSEWPMLKDVMVAWCPKVEIFASELKSFKDIPERNQLENPIKQPLFLVDDEDPFPSLENLRFSNMANLKIIWHNQNTADSFCKREIIKDLVCKNLIHDPETCVVTAPQLKELHLLHLPKLKRISNKDPQEMFSFQNPLEVPAMACKSMENPFPSAEQDFPETHEYEMDNYCEGPKLECFPPVPRVHTSDWPLLKELDQLDMY